jgi:hypothetical protein
MTPGATATDFLLCAHCSARIPPESWNAPHAICAFCRAPLQALVFPAFFTKPQAYAAVAAQEGEASCFYHPAKKAVVPCDQCGRFLCTLCQVDFQGQNWCPQCIDSRRTKGKLQNLETRRTLYDTMALQLAAIPAIWPFTGFTIVTAPITLFVVIRYWNAPSSIVPRSRIRMYIALILALLEIGGWAWLVIFLIGRLA